MITGDPSAIVRLEPGPLDTITDVPGVTVGHYTDETVYRGVTAILTTDGATAGVSVRGSNPGTMHTDALGPTTIGGLVHGIGLSGGSLLAWEPLPALPNGYCSRESVFSSVRH